MPADRKGQKDNIMKITKRFIASLLAVLTMTVMLGTTVFGATTLLDFDNQTMTISRGHSRIVICYNKSSNALDGVYVTNAKSSGTYAEILSNSNGTYKVALYIASDETSNGVSFWFYIADHDQYENVDVRVVDPGTSYGADTFADSYVGFQQQTADAIKNAAPGATVQITTTKWTSFSKAAITAWEARPDITLNVTFNTAIDTTCKISMPAGTDVASMVDAKGYIGFGYLYGAFAVQ